MHNMYSMCSHLIEANPTLSESYLFDHGEGEVDSI